MTHASTGRNQHCLRQGNLLHSSLVCLLASLLSLTAADAQQPGAPAQSFPPNRVVPAAAQVPVPAGPLVARNTNNHPAAVAGHPLNPALDLAYMALERSRTIRDCSFTFVKREEVNGQLTDYDFMFMKVRNEPFSVYVYCLGPVTAKGQEAIYVDGRNEGKVWAHPAGVLNKVVGTVSLLPTSARMMEGNRYPMTDAGPLKMLYKLIEYHEKERKFGECEVQITPGVRIDTRDCTCVQVVHPFRRQNFDFHKVCIFYDNELKLPIRFEAYDWPRPAGGQLPLVEEYTYRDLRFNTGMTDADFDINNPAYGFARK